MTEIINGAPVPLKVEGQGREAVAAWYATEGRYHKDHVEPLTKEQEAARLAAIAPTETVQVTTDTHDGEG